MNFDPDDRDPLWVTSVRCIAHEATAMPNPEIRALARIDIGVGAEAYAAHEPVSRRFATITDEPRRKLITCTPSTLAQTIWNPRPPDVVVGYGAACWDWFGPCLTRGIARVDLAKIARIIWPGAPSYEVAPLAAWVRSDYRGAEPPAAGHRRLAWTVKAMADLLAAALMVGGDRAIAYAETLGHSAASVLDQAFEGMRGDRRLEAFVRVSAAPMPPAAPAPAPWDEAHAWFDVGGEDLNWFASAETVSDLTRAAAEAELARRAAREADLLAPHFLLRRTDWG